MTRKTDPAHTARNDLSTMLRAHIETAIADFAKWEPICATSSFVTTAADCRIEYHRINGMIDALQVIDGNTHGLWAATQRAKIAACERCPEPSSILP
jgi:hypothetical protein